MLKIIKSTFKRIYITPISSAFLIFGLAISMTMFSFSTSFITELLNSQKNKIKHSPPNALMFNLKTNSSENIPLEHILDILKSTNEGTGVFFNNIMVNIDQAGPTTYYPVSCEWFTSKATWHYPLSKGRYYSAEEIEKGRKVVLIGGNILPYVDSINEKKFIEIFGEKYEVVGVVGLKGMKSSWDSRVFMPITSIPNIVKNTMKSGAFNMVIYNKNIDTKNEIDMILQQSKKNWKESSVSDISKLGKENIISQVFISMNKLMLVGILVYITSLVNAINMVNFWVENRRFEIGLRKAIGHSNFRIASLIYTEVIGIATLSCILAFIVQIFTGFFIEDFLGYSVNLYIENLFIGTIVIFITAFLTSILPIIKAFKIQPIESIKS